VPLDAYRELDPEAKPTLPGTHCVFGVLSLWLEDVEIPETLFDEERFERDPVYARRLADFNLVSYLIQGRDTRESNVLTSKDQTDRRVFSVDNGISFDPAIYNFFLDHWDDIRVPALSRSAIQKLRRVTSERWRALAVVAQFQVDAEGMLRPVEPTAPIAPERGVAYRDGTLQLGLTNAEIQHLQERVQELLRKIDADGIRLF
jgi:hypothetical protein